MVLKVMQQIGPKGLSSHLRKFCDYLICRNNVTQNGVDKVMEMIWKFHLVPLDRFILCLVSSSAHAVLMEPSCMLCVCILGITDYGRKRRFNVLLPNQPPLIQEPGLSKQGKRVCQRQRSGALENINVA